MIYLLFHEFFSIKCIKFAPRKAPVAKLVDAIDLGSIGSGLAGSSPVRRTN